MRPGRLVWGLVALTLVFVEEAEAQTAQAVEEGTITVIQPRPVLRRNRVSIAPRFGMTINDPLLRQFTAGGTLAFNIGERWAVGATYEQFDFGGVLGGPTDRYEEVIQQTDAVPEVARLRWYAGGEVSFVPVYGKLVLFNRAIGFWDLQGTVGGGVVESGGSIHWAATVAGSFNLYFTRWLGLYGEVREHMTQEELPSGTTLYHTVTASAGLTMFIPFGFTYSSEAR